MRSGRLVISAVGLLTLLCSGCGNASDNDEPGIANPASVYCAEQGGETEIVDEGDGEVGYCNLPDGSRVEEWEFYRSRVTTP